jgi:hypothetical protein
MAGGTLGISYLKRSGFQDKFPAFFHEFKEEPIELNRAR